MTLVLRELAKLCQSQAGITAAYKAGMMLQEKGWLRYPAANWSKPAILAFAGDECVGGLNYEIDEDDLAASVLFAFCLPSHPEALGQLLLRFRHLVRASDAEEIKLTCHAGNEQMARAVKLLRVEPTSMSYRMPVARPIPTAKPTLWGRIVRGLLA